MDPKGGNPDKPRLFTEAELRALIADELQRARGLKTVAEIKAGWKSRDEMEPGWRDRENMEAKPQGKVPQQAARTPTLAERLKRGLGLMKAKPPVQNKGREPEREP